ncbi:MAG: hypothetical protein U1E83_01735 [Methylotetracoccus sp.]
MIGVSADYQGRFSHRAYGANLAVPVYARGADLTIAGGIDAHRSGHLEVIAPGGPC